VNRGALEREVKLEVGVGFRVPDLDGIAPGVTARPQPEQHLQAIYIDTPDLRLARSGLTLRHRVDRSASATGSPGEWTLKLPERPSGPGLARREINWPGRWGPIPAEITGLLRAYRRTATLGPIARLVTQRRRTVLCGRMGEALLEIDDDVVSVMDGRRLAARFREVEVEVVGPAPESLLAVTVARLEEAGAVVGDDRPKLARAIGVRATEAPDVTPVPIGRASSTGDVIRAAIANGYLRLVAHDLGVRLDEDPEDVHQARVATRRLRSDLRTFRAFLPDDWGTRTRGELGWLAEVLGKARDADVLLERLQGQIASLDERDAGPAARLMGRLVAERNRARVEMMTAFESERYSALLDALAAAARNLPPRRSALVQQPVLAGAARNGWAASLVSDAPAGLALEPAPPSLDRVAAESAPGAAVAASATVSTITVPLGVGALPATLEAPAGLAEVAASMTEVPAPTAGAVVAVPPVMAVPVGRPVPSGAAAPGLPNRELANRELANRELANGELANGELANGELANRVMPELATPDRDGPDRETAARLVAPAIVAGPWRHLVRAVSALGPVPEDDALHEVRIRAKRLRYACEAVAEVAGKPATELAQAAADLQGVLGDFHDAIVCEEWLREASARATSAQALAAGQLIARQRDDAQQCRADWSRSWKRLNRKKLRAWLP
jgi:CHAD domain-containing protein